MGLEIVPAQLLLPVKPLPDKDWLLQRLNGKRAVNSARTIELRGLNTPPTSVATAERVSRVVLRDLDDALREGDRTRFWKILEDRPYLAQMPNISNTFCLWYRNGSLRAPRGRPRGSTSYHPLVVAGLIDQLVSAGMAANPERAFSLLGPLGIPYDSARQRYFQARREQRFRALLLVDEEHARPVEQGDLEWMACAQHLGANRVISRSLYDPALGGRVGIEFKAVK